MNAVRIAFFARVYIACRPNLANGELNGSSGYVVGHRHDDRGEAIKVWLTSGKNAGVCWWFGREDVYPVVNTEIFY